MPFSPFQCCKGLAAGENYNTALGEGMLENLSVRGGGKLLPFSKEVSISTVLTLWAQLFVYSPLMEKAKGNTIGETKILMLTSKLRPAIKKKRSARLRNDECTIMAMIMFSNNNDDDNYH